MLVEDADDEATRVLKGSDGVTNALAPAAKAKVAAISNFMVVYRLIGKQMGRGNATLG